MDVPQLNLLDPQTRRRWVDDQIARWLAEAGPEEIDRVMRWIFSEEPIE